jgi:hypothetical protein
MKTYAEYLTSLTVKTLNTIAKQGGYKGYSKLRKAALVAFIDGEAAIDHDGATYQAERETEIAAIELESTPNAKILDVTVEADVPAIVEIMAATVAPVRFSTAPVKAPESAPKARTLSIPSTGTDPLKEESTEDLIMAFQNMRATWHKETGARHARLTAKLIAIKAELSTRKGVNTREL